MTEVFDQKTLESGDQGELISDGVKQRTRLARELFGDVVQFVDFVLIILSSIIVAHLYHNYVIISDYEFQRYATAGIIGATGFTALSRRDGFYEFGRLLSVRGSIRSMLAQWGMVIFGLLAFAFALKVSDSFSRFWLFAWTGSSAALLVLCRVIATISLKRSTRRDGIFSRRIAVVGANKLGVKFADRATHSRDPVSIVGIYDLENQRTGAVKGLYAGGTLDDLMRAARNDEVDDIVIASDEVQSSALKELVRRLSAIMLVVAIAVKLQGKGPILFAQQRHGFNHEVFRIYKFRTMTVADDGDEIVQAKKGDARITPIGAFLRRYSLDELPQLLNVVKGNMSLVGPRPHALAHNHQYARTVENYSGRHKVKPGITGWAQVNGYRGETSENEMMADRVRYDLEYIDNWSLYFDFKILVLTIFAVLFPKNAH